MKPSSNKFTFILEKVKVTARQRPLLWEPRWSRNGFGCGFGYDMESPQVSISLRRPGQAGSRGEGLAGQCDFGDAEWFMMTDCFAAFGG